MASMTVKEWAAQYRLINEAEREEERRRLPDENLLNSVQSYFALCEFLVRLSPGAREAFAEERAKHYRSLAETYRRLALRHGYDFPS